MAIRVAGDSPSAVARIGEYTVSSRPGDHKRKEFTREMRKTQAALAKFCRIQFLKRPTLSSSIRLSEQAR
jgi:hypothetical protein